MDTKEVIKFIVLLNCLPTYKMSYNNKAIYRLLLATYKLTAFFYDSLKPEADINHIINA